jgi:dihydrofolate synthase/folylpolyglutamate synthase
MQITYFEAVTAFAFRYFAENKVEYAVMEVGMGGRLDAVNAAQEEIAIITTIGRDHTQYLGSQISQIAYEKAGILKKGLGITSAGEGLETIRAEARKRKRTLLVLGEDFDVVPLEFGADGSTFDYSNQIRLEKLKISLLGRFQLKNAAVAVCAAENLWCSEAAIRKGLEKARIRGRMEIVSKEPLVLVDAAHNPLGIKALVDSLDIFGERRIICVFSCMKDKDVQEMLRALGEKCSEFFVAKTAGNERAAEVEELEEIASEYGRVYALKSVSDAVKAALLKAKKEDLVLITGSIYMMEEVYKELGKK